MVPEIEGFGSRSQDNAGDMKFLSQRLALIFCKGKFLSHRRKGMVSLSLGVRGVSHFVVGFFLSAICGARVQCRKMIQDSTPDGLGYRLLTITVGVDSEYPDRGDFDEPANYY